MDQTIVSYLIRSLDLPIEGEVFLVIARNIPIVIPIETIEEPPYEIKGKVIPLAGTRLKFTAIWIKV